MTNLLLKILIPVSILTFSLASWSDQYQSNELMTNQGQTEQEVKTIAELEAELSQLKDAYSKDSTARFLARHYAQIGGEASFEKAVEYYRLSLSGEGLSIFAKQVTILELMSLYYSKQMYSEYLTGFKEYLSYEGKPTVETKIKRLLSHYHLENKKKSLGLAGQLLSEYQTSNTILDIGELNQLLFVFYNLNDILSSLKVQQAIIAKDSYNFEHWIRLSKLYLKNNQPQQAANTLLIAMQKGVDIDEENFLLMCDLMAKHGNPYIAARLMQQFFDAFMIDHVIENYDRLFRYWYLSQELELATDVLSQSLSVNQDTERYLDLAELYYQQQLWRPMNATIKQACDKDIDRKFVSRANFLLGISELKLGNDEEAEEAFVNATLVAGKAKEAIAYLEYMKVERPDPKKRRRIDGECEPISYR